MSLEQAVTLFFLMLVAQVPILITAVVAYLRNRTAIEANSVKTDAIAKKAKEVEDKLDNNTELTKAGTASATSNAIIAAHNSAIAATKAEQVARQMNGLLDERITVIVKTHTDSLLEALKLHIAQDEHNMAEIRKSLEAINASGSGTKLQ